MGVNRNLAWQTPLPPGYSSPIVSGDRVKDAIDTYYASPIAADGKVYRLNKACKLAVLKAAGEWEVLAVNAIKDDDCWATPAVADKQIFVRTQTALFCFEKRAI